MNQSPHPHSRSTVIPPAPPVVAKKSIRISVIRLVQGVFFVLVALIAANHVLIERGIVLPYISSASLHALCPFGGVTSIYQYIVAGTFVRRIQASALVIMSLVFLLAIPFGTLFCGWICPLGTFQEAIASIGKKLLGKRYNRVLPQKLDNALRYLRYGVLAWVLAMTILTSRLVFADYCPYDALFNIWTGRAAMGGLVVVGLMVMLSLLVERPFCKYACPYGALLGITNRFRIVKLKRNPDTCIQCGKCDQVCPMNLTISERDTINQTQCITCLQCTSQGVCPVDDTLNLQLPGFSAYGKQPLAVKPVVLGLLIAIVFAGGIAIAQYQNLWETKGNHEPTRIQQGDYAGSYDPADIRGAYTLGETSRYFDVPLEALAIAFDVPLELAAHVRQGDLEDYYHELDARGTEIGNGSVKLFVALYTGVPYHVDEPTYLLAPAVALLEGLGSLTTGQLAYIHEHRIEIDSFTPLDWDQLASNILAKSGTLEITGNTTYRDLLDAGLTQAEIESVIGGPMPDPGVTVQSDATARSTSFGKIRTALDGLLKQR